jgi:hypothetical protein
MIWICESKLFSKIVDIHRVIVDRQNINYSQLLYIKEQKVQKDIITAIQEEIEKTGTILMMRLLNLFNFLNVWVEMLIC